jgi:hypothetical protein
MLPQTDWIVPSKDQVFAFSYVAGTEPEKAIALAAFYARGYRETADGFLLQDPFIKAYGGTRHGGYPIEYRLRIHAVQFVPKPPYRLRPVKSEPWMEFESEHILPALLLISQVTRESDWAFREQDPGC